MKRGNSDELMIMTLLGTLHDNDLETTFQIATFVGQIKISEAIANHGKVLSDHR